MQEIIELDEEEKEIKPEDNEEENKINTTLLLNELLQDVVLEKNSSILGT